jgi:hypothetical protein
MFETIGLKIREPVKDNPQIIPPPVKKAFY